jgi:DeoR family ulaG and ulaABCDEF operon transcriptional repressor
MEADPLLIQAEKRLIGQAEELVVLVDSSKFARKAGLVLCGLNRVSTVITDTGASDSAVQLLEQYGVRVITVEPETLDPRVMEASALSSHDYAGVLDASAFHRHAHAGLNS